MPVRLLSSVVFEWPDRTRVLEAARGWAEQLVGADSAVQSVFCVGSYARDDWGVGSDLDVVVIVSACEPSPVERHRRFEPTGIPVPADVMVFTTEEWSRLAEDRPCLVRRLEVERLPLAARHDVRR